MAAADDALRPAGGPNHMTVRVSVVVPTFKRDDLLSRCLAALVQQDFDPGAYEVIVADDAASPETKYVVDCWQEQVGRDGSSLDLRYAPVPGPSHGPAAARNRGWQAARGEVIAFTDDDTVPAPDWLSAGTAALRDGVTAAAGQVVVPIDGVPTDYERNTKGLENGEFITANCFIRCCALAELGGFDERFTVAWREDSDLFLSLLERGHHIVFAADAIVVHPARPARWGVSLGQQRRNVFNALLFKKHPGTFRRWIQASPRSRYYSTVGSLLLGLLASAAGLRSVSAAAFAVWLALTGSFATQRLTGASRSPRHVAEMIVTSALIPPLSIYWRLRGALKWRVWYW